jgi:serine/threonine protein kinase/TolB-like protein
MDARRWQRISWLYHEVLQRAPSERDAFLEACCEGDDGLRQEVAALLQHTTARTLDILPEDPDVGLNPGVRLGSYQIERLLGRGGMGSVFLAHDTTLRRQVALKVIGAPPHDRTSHVLLLREARNAAALNHPNICTVYEVGEAGGRAFIAMEYVEGRTLADRLAAAALSVEEAVGYGIVIADAVAYAHEHGVIHRDLKAANAIVTPNGRLKLVDFGLARREDALLADATTMASLAPAGVAAGTPYAMAPEQVRGGATDPRTDIWALGVLLYEMVSGHKPFHSSTIPELFSSILRDEPASLPLHVPLAFVQLIQRCLAKDPADRFDRAADVRDALEATGREVSDGLVDVRRTSRPVASAKPIVRLAVTRRHAVWLSAVLATTLGGMAAWRFWPSSVAVRTLAVLPFENPAGDEDLDYLCEGVAESLIRRISALPSVRVSSLATVLDVRGRAIDPAAAGRRFEVETVMTGALRREGSRLLISAQLVDAATGRQLWSHSYDRDAAELLAVQDEIAGAIMDDGLRLRLNSEERERLVRHPTRDGDAYDLYLQARFIQRRATEEDYLYSRELLERAVIRDPMFALAYAALSGNYAMMTTDGLERPTDAWPQVNRYMRRALEIDPDLPDAHAFAHAIAFLFDWDWTGAARARQRLLQFPVRDFDVQVLRAMAMEHWALGRADEALQLARRTRELDPGSPFLAILEADYLLRSGQPDAAATLYEYVIKLEPDNPNAFFGLAEARAAQGRHDAALTARRQAHALAGDERLEPLFRAAHGEDGYRQIDQAWARLQLEALREREPTNYVSPLDFARAYAQLAERELAFKYLEAAFVDRSPGLVFLKVDPAWAKVRDDPRFAAAVQRVGLP